MAVSLKTEEAVVPAAEEAPTAPTLAPAAVPLDKKKACSFCTKTGCIGCAAYTLVVSINFWIFSIWAVFETNRFEPFFTPAQCTQPFIMVPVHKYVDMTTGDMNIVDLPLKMLCSNPNELEINFGTSTSGDMLLPNPDGTTVDVGDVTLPSSITFPKQGKDVPWLMHVNMFLPALVVQAIQAQVMAEGMAYAVGNLTYPFAGPPIPAAPLFFSLDLETKTKSSFMWFDAEDTGVIPKKYCGVLLTLIPPDLFGNATTNPTGAPIPAGALMSVSKVLCRNSIEDVMPLVIALDRTAGAKQPNKHSYGYIDNIDPTDKYLKDSKDTFDSTSGFFMATFFIVASLTLVGSIVCVVMGISR